MSTTTEQTTGTRTWEIDPAHTQVAFEVKHMMFAKVRGHFDALEGTLQYDPDGDLEDAAVEVKIDAASINTGQSDRDDHLRSADFLDVEGHPDITFESTSIRDGAGNGFTIVGDLTIRGTTREVELEAELAGRGTDPWGSERVAFSATTTIDRREFGLTWNQALETGGILVGEKLKISLDVQATPASD